MKLKVWLSFFAVMFLGMVITQSVGPGKIHWNRISAVSSGRILCRTTAGPGDIESCTSTQVKTLLNLVANDLTNSTTAGRALVTAADASAQRTTLGLGSLATLSSISTSQISDGAVTSAKLENSGVTAGSCGSATQSAGITVDAKGRITALSCSTISSGSVSDAGYIVTAPSAALSAETAISGLLASPDIVGRARSTFSEEFSSGASPFSWTVAPTTETVGGTMPDHLYLAYDSASESLGTAAYSPAGDFDIRTKVTVGMTASINQDDVGLVVSNSGRTAFVLIHLSWSNGWRLQAYDFAGSYTQRGSTVTAGAQASMYLRITRVGSTITTWFSDNGLLWVPISASHTNISVALYGLRLAGLGLNTAIDWIGAS